MCTKSSEMVVLECCGLLWQACRYLSLHTFFPPFAATTPRSIEVAYAAIYIYIYFSFPFRCSPWSLLQCLVFLYCVVFPVVDADTAALSSARLLFCCGCSLASSPCRLMCTATPWLAVSDRNNRIFNEQDLPKKKSESSHTGDCSYCWVRVKCEGELPCCLAIGEARARPRFLRC